MDRHRIIAMLLSLSILAPTSASARVDGAGIIATLDGTPITISRAADMHCHDLDYPIIRCFRSERRVLAAIRTSVPRRRRLPGGRSVLNVSYVRLFEDANFGGSSIYLSAPYPNLSVIGWNDRVSSFKSVNNGDGVFSEHINGGGTDTSFCCDSTVGYVGAAKNDTFSSVSGSA